MSITISIKQGQDVMDIDIPTEWKDINIEYWGKMNTIITSHQEKSELKKNYYKDKELDLDIIENTLSDIEFKDGIALNKDIFSFITGIDRENIMNVEYNQVQNVISLIEKLTEEYKPKGIKSFDFEGETYMFPSEMLRQNTYGDFIESTQLDMTIENMKNGRYDVLPEQIAILCRKDGEKYDEDLVTEKAIKFKKLNMEVAFEFAFFLTKRSEMLLKISNMYLERKEKV
jgi:hypothetical protein